MLGLLRRTVKKGKRYLSEKKRKMEERNYDKLYALEQKKLDERLKKGGRTRKGGKACETKSTPKSVNNKNDQKDIYEVERIVGKKNGKYIVKWKGYSSKYNTLEPATNIFDKKLIENWNAKNKRGGSSCKKH